MKVISNEKTATNTVELEVQVSGETLDEAMDRVYQANVESINVPGFRKGKAPRKIIEAQYGPTVFLEDAVNDLISEAYSFAIDETGIEPVSPLTQDNLEVELEDIKNGFSMKATVTVKPEVTVGEYKGIEADKVIPTITDEQVDAEIERLRMRGAREIDVEDRPAENGDFAIIDFEGFVDNVAFEGGQAENHRLEIGSGSFIEGFEEQIIGKNVNDAFDVEVTFPEEYHAEELAGQPAVFKVKLNALKMSELPELDDEFAKDVSEFDTLEELKASLRDQLFESAEQTAQENLENQLVDKIVEDLEGEIPEVMFESRIDQMMQEFAQRLQSQGMTLELYLQYTGMDEESFRKTFRAQAERQVKIRLALEKIVELEEIIPTEDDMNKEYETMAEMYQMPADELKKLIRNEDLEQDVAANLAIDIIRENAKVSEISEKEAKAKAEKEQKAEEDESQDEENASTEEEK